MCGDPSRLVWPIVAVALAGRSTSPVECHRELCGQPCSFRIFVTVPDGDVTDTDA